MHQTSLRRVETWIFDLDDTLYPPSSGVLPAIDARITARIARHLGIDLDAADRMRRDLWQAHGLTLTGLVAEHGVDPGPFLADVHAVPLDTLSPDPALTAAIAGLPGRRIVHTNGARAHALRVLAARGLSGLFDGVHAIEDKGLVPKPDPAAYADLLAAHRIDPARAAMIEDTHRNLVEPRRLGMATIWLAFDPAAETPPHVDHRTEKLVQFLRDLG